METAANLFYPCTNYDLYLNESITRTVLIGVACQAHNLHEAFYGIRLRRCGQPSVLQEQHGHVVRRREENV